MKRYCALLLLAIALLLTACSDDSGPAEPPDITNKIPKISSLTTTADTLSFCYAAQLTCTASDADGDNLTFAWDAPAGSFTGSGKTVTWKAPFLRGDFELRCSVSDGYGGHDVDSLRITVLAPEGLIAHFPFVGNANDESGNANHGTPYGVTPRADRFGRDNAAYHFDGAVSYISVTNSGNMSPTTGVTIAAWVKRDPSIKRVMPIYDRIETHDGYGLMLVDSGYPRISINGGAAECTSRRHLGPDQEWHYIVGTYESLHGKIKIYVDANAPDSTEYWDYIDYDPEPRNEIGRLNLGQEFFLGTIDDVSVFDHALSPADIERYFNE